MHTGWYHWRSSIRMTLYLKYRPQKISELDLLRVREELLQIVSSKSLPHAFLFAGPKGTGKTSAARILAKAINCEKNEIPGEPCNECSACLAITAGTHIDVMEMDAASNRGIDDVRALREQIVMSPLEARRKIYIIDEAHMLTTEAANALLKTLEEPPAHAVFILATTDPQKLPGTIQSRLTLVPFQKASNEEIIAKLTRIAESESIEFEAQALESIANASDGAFRDAVKLFETLSRTGKIVSTVVDQVLMGSTTLNPQTFVNSLLENDPKSALESLGNSLTTAQAKAFISAVAKHLHELLLAEYGIGTLTARNRKDDILRLLDIFIDVNGRIAQSPIPSAPLVFAVATYSSPKKNSNFIEQASIPPEKKVEKQPAPVTVAAPVAQTPEPQIPEPIAPVPEMPSPVSFSEDCDQETWQRLLQTIRVKNASVEALLRAAKPMGLDGDGLSVSVFYRFHKERLEVNVYKDLFEEAAQAVFGKRIKVSYVLTDRPVELTTLPSEPSLTSAQQPDIINAAQEIFGN